MNNENASQVPTTTIPQAKPQKLLLFPSALAARQYRHEHGTGGWIFTNQAMTILFPPDVTPTGVFNHPVTRNHEGELIGCQ